MGNKRIMILVPCRTNTVIDVSESWLRMIMVFQSRGYEVDMRMIRNKPVDIALEELTRNALKVDFEYAFFTSDDQIFNEEDLLKLLDVCDNMVSPVILRKKLPFIPVLYTYGMNNILDYPKDKVIDAIGPLCLVHRRVFEAIDKKYPGEKFFDFTDEHSEDIGFFKKVIACGFKPKVHTGVGFGHWGAIVQPCFYEDLFKDSVIKQLSSGLSEDGEIKYCKDSKAVMKINYHRNLGLNIELVNES